MCKLATANNDKYHFCHISEVLNYNEIINVSTPTFLRSMIKINTTRQW